MSGPLFSDRLFSSNLPTMHWDHTGSSSHGLGTNHTAGIGTSCSSQPHTAPCRTAQELSSLSLCACAGCSGTKDHAPFLKPQLIEGEFCFFKIFSTPSLMIHGDSLIICSSQVCLWQGILFSYTVMSTSCQ